MNNLQGDAGKRRLVAAILDNALAIILGMITAVAVPNVPDAARGFILVGTYLGYFLIMEGSWGRTVGKAVRGLVVKRMDGTRAGWREALIRTAFRIVEVNPLLLGALPAGLAIMWSKKRQRFGDMLAGTIVVERDALFGNAV